MQNQVTAATSPHAAKITTTISKPLQLTIAILLGTVILYGAGFVNMAVVHNAAHDIRHSQGFPCH